MKTWKRIAATLGMGLGAGTVWLAVATYRTFSSVPSFFQWGSWKDYALLVTMALLGAAVFWIAYRFGFRWGADASPNGGPATRSDRSGVTDGPPSVS